MAQHPLLVEAKEWVLENQCPLPVDLYTDLMGAGFDAGTIQDQLLKENA